MDACRFASQLTPSFYPIFLRLTVELKGKKPRLTSESSTETPMLQTLKRARFLSLAVICYAFSSYPNSDKVSIPLVYIHFVQQVSQGLNFLIPRLRHYCPNSAACGIAVPVFPWGQSLL